MHQTAPPPPEHPLTTTTYHVKQHPTREQPRSARPAACARPITRRRYLRRNSGGADLLGLLARAGKPLFRDDRRSGRVPTPARVIVERPGRGMTQVVGGSGRRRARPGWRRPPCCVRPGPTCCCSRPATGSAAAPTPPRAAGCTVRSGSFLHSTPPIAAIRWPRPRPGPTREPLVRDPRRARAILARGRRSRGVRALRRRDRDRMAAALAAAPAAGPRPASAACAALPARTAADHYARALVGPWLSGADTERGRRRGLRLGPGQARDWLVPGGYGHLV